MSSAFTCPPLCPGASCVVSPFTFPLEFSPAGPCEEFHEWVKQIVQIAEAQGVGVSAFLVNHHWHPVKVVSGTGSVTIFLIPESLPWIKNALAFACRVSVFQLPQRFQHDCGFQSISWLFHVHDGSVECDIPGVTKEQGLTWRSCFANHLQEHGGWNDIPRAPLALGGGGQFDPVEKLTQLLKEHGVAENAAYERAQTVLEKLGRASVLNALRSGSPWRDLKYAANHLSPKLQLVLSSELQDLIKQRAANPKPIVTKKAKQPKPKAAPVCHVTAADVQVPDGMFKEGTDVPLTQINSSMVGPDARGILVVDPFEAVPYLKMGRKASSRGLGMIVVGAQADLLHGLGKELKFPVKCTANVADGPPSAIG